MKHTINGSLHKIMDIFLEPMIHVIVRACNSSVISVTETIDYKDAVHFIRCLIALSIYRVTPNNFFQKKHLFPLAKKFNQEQWQKVLYKKRKA